MNTEEINSSLRDAARPTRGRVHQPPAQRLLERIVRTDRTADAGRVAVPVKRRAGNVRWAVAGVGAVAATGVALVAPNIVGGGDQAFASWTPKPTPLSAAEADALGRECRGGEDIAAMVGKKDAGPARSTLGERRGDYAYVSLAAEDWSLTCFRDRAGKVHEGSIMADPVTDAQLGGKGIELQAWGQVQTDEGYARLMAGHLGKDVVAVDIKLPKTGKTVYASVEDQYFVAWYPESLADNEQGADLTLRLAGGGTVTGLAARELMDAPKLD